MRSVRSPGSSRASSSSTFSVPADFDRYRSHLEERFPEEREGLDRFFSLVREAYLYGLLYFFRGRRHERLAPLEPLTLRDAIDAYIRDPKLRLILAADCGHWGSPPARTSFVFDAMLRLSYFLGNYYPVGGSQVFADDLAGVFERRGGHVLMRAAAERILVESGAAAGVRLSIGAGTRRRQVTVRARHVVSNADLRVTVEHLLAPGVADPDTRAAVRRLRPTMPCYLTHLGLRAASDDLLAAASGYHWRGWDAERVADDAFKVFVPTMYEPAMAPAGHQIVILQKLVADPFEEVSDWSEQKRRVEADLLERAEAVLPGLGGQVVVGSSASALTARRFTTNTEGAMLGWEMSPAQLGEGRPGIETGVRGLYLVGHWTRPGGGITPVIVSAQQAARLITGSTPRETTLVVPGGAPPQSGAG